MRVRIPPAPPRADDLHKRTVKSGAMRTSRRSSAQQAGLGSIAVTESAAHPPSKWSTDQAPTTDCHRRGVS